MDREAAARAIAAFLRAIGHEPTGELAATPELVAEAWTRDLLSGRDLDPARILSEGGMALEDRGAAGSAVTLRDLAVTTVCPHHLMPAFGTADIIYLPEARVAGFGTIAQALVAVTRRLSLQEAAGATLARVVVSELGARSAACRLRLSHTCLIARGARAAGATVETLAFAGSAAEPGADRDLILRALS